MIESMTFKGKDYEAGIWLSNMLKMTHLEINIKEEITSTSCEITISFEGNEVRKLLRRLTGLVGLISFETRLKKRLK